MTDDSNTNARNPDRGEHRDRDRTGDPAVFRTATAIWLTVSGINFLVWLMVTLIRGQMGTPWFLWAFAAGGVLVGILRGALHARRRSQPADQHPPDRPASSFAPTLIASTAMNTSLHHHPGIDPVRLNNVTKTYGTSDNATVALRGVSLTFPRRSFTAVMGPSGSGKSTLLQCAAGLDTPDAGEVLVDGDPFPATGENDVTTFRRDRIGFVFQQYNLIGHITVLDNVLLPLRLAGRRASTMDAHALLTQLGLNGVADRLPAALSGGQQQRVAIARTLLAQPSVLFADEPTGALDSTSGATVLALLRESCDQHGQTVITVTHDPVAAAWADTVVFLADGLVVDRITSPDATTVAERMTALSITNTATSTTMPAPRATTDLQPTSMSTQDVGKGGVRPTTAPALNIETPGTERAGAR